MITTGTPSAACAICSSTRGSVIPCSSAVWVARSIVGPSAKGSENGTPTSMKSAPAASRRRNASPERAGVGKPAVRYGISAARRRPAGSTPTPRARQRAAIGCSDKVVADRNAVLHGVGHLDDRPGVAPVGVLLREIGQEPRLLRRPLGLLHHPHHDAVHR